MTHPMPDVLEPRRRFLELVTTTLLAVPILGPLLYSVGVVVGAGRSHQSSSVPTIPLGDIPEGKPRRFRMHYQRRHGAFVEEANRIVFLRREGQTVIALSAECTHLGCNVSFDASAGRLICPCHKGVFRLDGSVESGPPPHPLRRYEAVIPADPSSPVTLQV